MDKFIPGLHALPFICGIILVMRNTVEPFFKIDPKKIKSPILRLSAGLSKPLIERALCFPGLNEIYRGAQQIEDGESFPFRIMESMNVKWDVHSLSPDILPSSGPVVVVANHPFGGVEGILLLALLERYRRDSKAMANYMLSMIPELKDYFFAVDPFGGENAKRANLKSMKSCIKWLEEGHVLGVFPAGEVSSIDLKSGKVRDPAWSPTIARMVRRTNATVVPLFFSGNNGVLFNMAGLVHPRLRTIMLPKQFANKKNRTIHVEVGQPITPKEMEEYDTEEKLTGFLRLRTYILGEREAAKEAEHHACTKSHKALPAPKQEPIIPPVDPELLRQEIVALQPEERLCEGDGLEVYCAKAEKFPNVLREIGRLREITYRGVGEGTNMSIDLDPYDNYYLHLFIWNPKKSEIVGAYRLGLADEIVPTLGVRGLYTHTCFKFNEKLITHLQPAIELGRSFVRKEYQRAYSSLMLLWKGLCIFVARNPKYKTFFGPVSISNDYLDTSRNMILRSLRFSNFENELARLVRPRCKPRRMKRAEWNLHDYDNYIDNLDEVSKLVQEIESDQKGIPVLLRQYVKMGGKILAFNVDPAFNYCVDGLIAVNVPNVDPKVLKRYMGTEGYENYLKVQGK